MTQPKLFDQSSLYVPAVSIVDSVTGSPFSISSQFYDAVSLGLVSGFSRVGAFGNNPDVDTGTLPEDCWTGGGLYPWMTAMTSLEVVSSSVSDSSAGVGARTITISGLNDLYMAVSQSITLNGTTPVAVPLQLFRINSSLITSAGTSQVNVGDITIRDTGAGAIRAIIPTGFGMTRQAPYTVVAGSSLLIKQLFLNIQSPSGTVNQYANMTTFFRSSAGVYRLPITIGCVNGAPYSHPIDPPIFVAEKTDFSLRTLNVSDSNTNITCAWNGILRVN